MLVIEASSPIHIFIFYFISFCAFVILPVTRCSRQPVSFTSEFVKVCVFFKTRHF